MNGMKQETKPDTAAAAPDTAPQSTDGPKEPVLDLEPPEDRVATTDIGPAPTVVIERQRSERLDPCRGGVIADDAQLDRAVVRQLAQLGGGAAPPALHRKRHDETRARRGRRPCFAGVAAPDARRESTGEVLSGGEAEGTLRHDPG